MPQIYPARPSQDSTADQALETLTRGVVFMGKIDPNGACTVIQVLQNGAVQPLNPRHDLYNHSPNGFAWGYEGSGPAQLALAVCAEVLGDDQHDLSVYQDFKRALIAGLAIDTD